MNKVMLENFRVGDIVALRGIDKRGKERVANFGPEFRIRSFEIPGVQDNRILFESTTDCFRVGEHLTTWSGWLEPNREVEVTEVL